MIRFTGTLWRSSGKGGWTFVDVPDHAAPDAAGPWGRTPIRATVDGHTWDTSLWRSKDGSVLLPVPKTVGGAKVAGDEVDVELAYR